MGEGYAVRVAVNLALSVDDFDTGYYAQRSETLATPAQARLVSA